MATAFDTLTISRSIREAGVDERAADAITHAIVQSTAHGREELATKSQLEIVEQRLGKQIAESINKATDAQTRVALGLAALIISVGGLIVAAIKLL